MVTSPSYNSLASTVVDTDLEKEPPLEVTVSVTMSESVRRASEGTATWTKTEVVTLGEMVAVLAAGVMPVTHPLTLAWETE